MGHQTVFREGNRAVVLLDPDEMSEEWRQRIAQIWADVMKDFLYVEGDGGETPKEGLPDPASY